MDTLIRLATGSCVNVPSEAVEKAMEVAEESGAVPVFVSGGVPIPFELVDEDESFGGSSFDQLSKAEQKGVVKTQEERQARIDAKG